MTDNFENLARQIRKCDICVDKLPLGPNPVFQASTDARILIAAQAPGIRVHNTSLPFNDPSGDRLREWLKVDRETFYNPQKFSIIPMGFCYPGTGKSGDLPPRPECATTWRKRLLSTLPNIRLTLVIGQYAQHYHLGESRQHTLTETVRAWRDYQPHIIPLPHPSPRNNIWLKKNPWFNEQVIPTLQTRIAALLSESR